MGSRTQGYSAVKPEEPVMNFTNPEYLVSTAWLADHLDDDNIVVLDVTAKLTSKLGKPGRRRVSRPQSHPGLDLL